MRSGLEVDFYLLVLAAVYHADGLWGEATFDLTLRRGGAAEPWVVVSGIHEAIDAALSVRFSDEEVAWLREQRAFAHASEGWWQSLIHFEFTGDIHAMPEGTLAYPGEPVVRVTAPLQQATLVHSLLVQAMSLGSSAATRAVRLTQAAGDRRLYEFAGRHAGGPQSAALVTRGACVGGFYASSNAGAAMALGVPAMGTLSSGFFASYGGTGPALQAFSVHFPDVGYVNLPPGKVADAVRSLVPYRDHIKMVRVDHSQLGRAARVVRQVLDKHGLEQVLILGSGSLDVAKLRALGDAPVDLVAVGKALVQGPQAAFQYRLAEMWRGPDAVPVRHPGGARFPGAKQVMRFADHDRLVVLAEELEAAAQGGVPLLEPMVIQGERVQDVPSVAESAARCREQLAALGDAPRPVRASARLAALEQS